MRTNHLIDPIGQLSIALDFAQTDLSTADAPSLSNDLYDFLSAGREIVRGKPWPTNDLVNAQRDVLGLFRGIVDHGFFVATDLHLKITVVRADVVSARMGRRILAGVSGSLRDRLLFRVIELLQELGIEKVRACPAPECRRLFFKITQKKFCSSQCQKRIWARERAQADRELDAAFQKESSRAKTTRTR